LSPKRLLIYADGGSRGNPGPAGAGAYLEDEAGEAVARIYKYLGETTNNVAEYSALIFGLKEAQRQKADEVTVRMDSQLVVKQIGGEYRVKEPTLQKLHGQVMDLLGGFKRYHVEHIPREKNGKADELANLAMDKGPSKGL
jgi:ribonuclease HI